ncbi:MAG: hypothetical protein MMC23_006835 [Stictis urceolatum]|nr:hypothetical protein [Stictis urceolata]
MSTTDSILAEIQFNILKQLSGDALLNLRQTNHFWRATIDANMESCVDSIIQGDLALEHEFFETWRKLLGSEVIKERAVTAILETELFERNEVKKGILGSAEFPQDLYEIID